MREGGRVGQLSEQGREKEREEGREGGGREGGLYLEHGQEVFPAEVRGLAPILDKPASGC